MPDSPGDDTDVFVSYAREDRSAAQKLCAALTARGLRVWWDHDLVGGDDFRATIQQTILAARRVVVLWSPASVRSAFVIDEARLAASHGKLVPVSIAGTAPPLGFGQLHTLSHAVDGPDFEALVAALEGRRPAPAKPPAPSRRRLLATLGSAGAAAAIGGAGWWLTGRSGFWSDASAAPGNRIALVVGSGDYAHLPKLRNTVNDAEVVTDALRERSFKVLKLIDGSRGEITDAIERFKTLLSIGGVGVFYHAGHAFFSGGRDYVLPVDARAFATQDEQIAESIDISEVRGPIRMFFARRRQPVRLAGLCIATDDEEECLDTSGAPGVVSDALPPQSPISTALAPQPPDHRDNGVVMVYSAAEGQVAFDGQGDHSPFAEALLAEIGVGSGDVIQVAKRVRKAVYEATNRQQFPVLEDGSYVNFAFNRPELDPPGVLRIVMMDSCRDNPFEVRDALR